MYIKLNHMEPGPYSYDFILLPYGAFYHKTLNVLEAKRGDIIRFFNGPEATVILVKKIPMDDLFSALCMMRYGYPRDVVLRRWQDNARLEGNGRDIISKKECILLIYAKDQL